MTQVTQENLRSILPGKIARTIMLISEEEKSSVKNALLKFYKSSVYKELEIDRQSAGGRVHWNFLRILRRLDKLRFVIGNLQESFQQAMRFFNRHLPAAVHIPLS